ncbi:MAG: undecaprenyl-diphosphate phosphatase [Acidimicrobiia bacterium]
MLDAIFWGIIQGLTEFLPISSSGHLVLIPALLGREGPDLATSAMLHLGTLGAVIVFYRSDLAEMAKFDRPARRLITILAIGTIPAAALGLALEDKIEELVADPVAVAVMMIITGLILLSTTMLRLGDRTIRDVGVVDSIIIGISQAFALIPGVSRSGMTMSSGLARGMERRESARFAFLLGIPVIAGAGLLQIVDVIAAGESIPAEVWVGMVAAGLSGYAAISLLIRLLGRTGLAPYGIYCVAFGAISIALL